MKKNIYGFSIIELIIVIGIMAIIATIAIPEFTKWKTKYSIESDTKKLAGFLQQARLKAFTEKIELDIIKGSGKKICFKCDNSDSDCISKYGNGNISCVELDNDFSFSGVVNITKRGTLNNKTIKYSGTYYGDINYNCVVLRNIRIKIGKWNGAKCVVK